MVKKCHVCGNEYKPFEIKLWNFTRTLYVSTCDCKENYWKNIVTKDLIRDLLYDSHIDKEFWIKKYPITLSELNVYATSIKQQITNGTSLLIYGEAGRGKTTMVSNILLTAIHSLYTVKYYRTSEIARMFNLDTEIKKCKLLCIDNFGLDEYESKKNIVFDLIDFRLNNKLATIIISNLLSADEASQIFNAPLISRLKGKFVPIYITGTDLRENLWKESNFGKEVLAIQGGKNG